MCGAGNETGARLVLLKGAQCGLKTAQPQCRTAVKSCRQVVMQHEERGAMAEH